MDPLALPVYTLMMIAGFLLYFTLNRVSEVTCLCFGWGGGCLLISMVPPQFSASEKRLESIKALSKYSTVVEGGRLPCNFMFEFITTD